MNLGSIIKQVPRGLVTDIPASLIARPGLSAAENAGRLDSMFRTVVDAGTSFTGGDGVYSHQVGDRTLFSFGDTYVKGLVGNWRLPSPVFRNTFVRSTQAEVGSGQFRLIAGNGWQRLAGKGEFLQPPTKGEWYWPAGVTQTDAGVQMLLTRFVHEPKGAIRATGDWAWGRRGTDIATLDPKSLDLIDLRPMNADASTSWGAALTKVDGDVFAYGSRQGKDGVMRLTVAKTSADDIRTGWSYLTDDGSYSTDPARAGVTDLEVSNQFSVLPGDDGAVHVIAQRGFEPAVYVTRGESPAGPFDVEGSVRKELPAVQNPQYLYNAIAHPQFSDDERVVVSVMQNRFDGSTFHARDYLPRFLTIPRPGTPSAQQSAPLQFGR